MAAHEALANIELLNLVIRWCDWRGWQSNERLSLRGTHPTVDEDEDQEDEEEDDDEDAQMPDLTLVPSNQSPEQQEQEFFDTLTPLPALTRHHKSLNTVTSNPPSNPPSPSSHASNPCVSPSKLPTSRPKNSNSKFPPSFPGIYTLTAKLPEERIRSLRERRRGDLSGRRRCVHGVIFVRIVGVGAVMIRLVRNVNAAVKRNLAHVFRER